MLVGGTIGLRIVAEWLVGLRPQAFGDFPIDRADEHFPRRALGGIVADGGKVQAAGAGQAIARADDAVEILAALSLEFGVLLLARGEAAPLDSLGTNGVAARIGCGGGIGGGEQALSPGEDRRAALFAFLGMLGGEIGEAIGEAGKLALAADVERGVPRGGEAGATTRAAQLIGAERMLADRAGGARGEPVVASAAMKPRCNSGVQPLACGRRGTGVKLSRSASSANGSSPARPVARQRSQMTGTSDRQSGGLSESSPRELLSIRSFIGQLEPERFAVGQRFLSVGAMCPSWAGRLRLRSGRCGPRR